jgi:hypothetical protein
VSATADRGEDANWRRARRTLKDGGEVDGGTGTHTLGVVALLQQTVDTTDGKLEGREGGQAKGQRRGGDSDRL